MPTLTLKDGNGNTVTMPTSADGATYHVIEQGGTAVGSSNALFVTDTAAEASVAATAAAAGTVADTAFVGTGTASIIAALKGVYAKLAGTLTVTDTAAEASLATVATETTAIATASGTTADAAYAGSGSSSILAALKGIYAAIKGTLTISVPTLSYSGCTFGSVTTSSAQLVAAAAYAKSLTLQNTGTAGNVWINPTGGTAVVGSGYSVGPGGGSFTFGTNGAPVPTGAIFAISDAGTNNVAIMGG
jgi:hypothetical protein